MRKRNPDVGGLYIPPTQAEVDAEKNGSRPTIYPRTAFCLSCAYEVNFVDADVKEREEPAPAITGARAQYVRFVVCGNCGAPVDIGVPYFRGSEPEKQ